MAIRKIGRYWYAYWKENGKYIIRTTKCTERRKAEIVARDMMVVLRSFKVQQRSMPYANIPHPYPPIVSRDNSGKHSLESMFSIACKYRKLSHLHELLWNRFVNGCGKKYAEDVTPKVALDFLESLNCKSNKTYNNNKTVLNTVFRLCFADTGVESPLKNILNRVVDNVKSHRNITEEEFKLILEHASPFWKFMANLSYHTGMPKECCLRFCPDWIVYIDGKPWAKYLRSKTSRFGRHCQVPLKKEVLESFPTGVEGSTPFCSVFGIPKHPRINEEFGELLKKLNIIDNDDGHVDFHSLRSSFITNCRSQGIPDHAIRSMVGHTDSAVTDIYSHDTTTPLMLIKDDTGRKTGRKK